MAAGPMKFSRDNPDFIKFKIYDIYGNFLNSENDVVEFKQPSQLIELINVLGPGWTIADKTSTDIRLLFRGNEAFHQTIGFTPKYSTVLYGSISTEYIEKNASPTPTEDILQIVNSFITNKLNATTRVNIKIDDVYNKLVGKDPNVFKDHQIFREMIELAIGDKWEPVETTDTAFRITNTGIGFEQSILFSPAPNAVIVSMTHKYIGGPEFVTDILDVPVSSDVVLENIREFLTSKLSRHDEDPQYETIIIPKGTMLFRGMNSTSALTSDFAGVPKPGNTFCLGKYHNVFFYPFPFVADSVKPYAHIFMYATTRDLKLVNLILPSKFSRQDRMKRLGGIASCSMFDIGCDLTGFDFDPCIDYSVVKEDVAGMIAIANMDAKTLKAKKLQFNELLDKYFTTYKDVRKTVGVPELILHPRADKSDRTDVVSDFESWYTENKPNFNYHYIHGMRNDRVELMKFMDKLLSNEGPFLLKMNKTNGFFQIEELSDNVSDLITPDLTFIPSTLTKGKLYKQIKSEYGLADTVPAELTKYTKSGPDIEIDLTSGAKKYLSDFVDEPIRYHGFFQPENNGGDVYLIKNKAYIFWVTPESASVTSPNDGETYTDHPINNYISAYEIEKPQVSNGRIHLSTNRQPAREINGLMQHYLEKVKKVHDKVKETIAANQIQYGTIPGSLTTVYKIGNLIGMDMSPEATSFLATVSDKPFVMSDSNRVFTIKGKHYVFWFTPEIETLFKNDKTIEENKELKGLPANEGISAYEVGFNTVTNEITLPENRQPAVEINKLLHDKFGKKETIVDDELKYNLPPTANMIVTSNEGYMMVLLTQEVSKKFEATVDSVEKGYKLYGIHPVYLYKKKGKNYIFWLTPKGNEFASKNLKNENDWITSSPINDEVSAYEVTVNPDTKTVALPENKQPAFNINADIYKLQSKLVGAARRRTLGRTLSGRRTYRRPIEKHR